MRSLLPRFVARRDGQAPSIRRFRYVLGAVCLGVVLSLASAAAATPDEIAVAIGARLDAAAGGTLPIDGRTVPADPVRAFYQQREYRPIWIEQGGPNGRAQGLLEGLREARKEGLNPADYDPGEVATSSSSADDLAVSELKLTAALVRYAGDVASGQVPQEKIDSDELISPKPVDVVALLQTAASASDTRALVAGLAPQHLLYTRLRGALATYRAAAEAGGLPRIGDGPAMRSGVNDPRVPDLRLHLQRTGDLVGDDVTSQHFDAPLAEAVRRYQKRNNLKVSGTVDEATRTAMNVPVDTRIKQILVNLERTRWLPANLGDPYILVNLADFTLEVVEQDRRMLEMRVVVGKPANRSPVFSDEMEYVEINPYWNVPASIATKEIAPILRKNPGYLAANNMKVFSGGKAVDPSTINWSDPSAGTRYRIRQEPGGRNALGKIKFMLPNQFDVYLHDTPSKGLFSRSHRAFSHGCIRLEHPIDLAVYVLGRNADAWSRKRIEAAIARGRNQAVYLDSPLPVHIAYLTVWVDHDGTVQFRQDFYGRDKRLGNTLFASAR